MPVSASQVFHVVAARVDDGTLWELDVLALPGIRLRVRDINNGGRAARAAIAGELNAVADDIRVAITLS